MLENDENEVLMLCATEFELDEEERLRIVLFLT
jgi:hypothetical protein